MELSRSNDDFLLVEGLSKMLESANINLLMNEDPVHQARWTYHKQVIERTLEDLKSDFRNAS